MASAEPEHSDQSLELSGGHTHSGHKNITHSLTSSLTHSPACDPAVLDGFISPSVSLADKPEDSTTLSESTPLCGEAQEGIEGGV